MDFYQKNDRLLALTLTFCPWILSSAKSSLVFFIAFLCCVQWGDGLDVTGGFETIPAGIGPEAGHTPGRYSPPPMGCVLESPIRKRPNLALDYLYNTVFIEIYTQLDALDANYCYCATYWQQEASLLQQLQVDFP